MNGNDGSVSEDFEKSESKHFEKKQNVPYNKERKKEQVQAKRLAKSEN